MPRLRAPVHQPLGDRRHRLDRRHAGHHRGRAARHSRSAARAAVARFRHQSQRGDRARARQGRDYILVMDADHALGAPPGFRFADSRRRRVLHRASLRGHRVRHRRTARRSDRVALRRRAARVRDGRRPPSHRCPRRSVGRRIPRGRAQPRSENLPEATPRSSRPRWPRSRSTRAMPTTSRRA